MNVLLHIGQSKTGTSAIQAYLTLNRGGLEKQGFLYPQYEQGAWQVDVGSHNAVADALVGLSRYPYLTAAEYFDAFFNKAERVNASTLILSAEHFFGGEPRIWNVNSEEEYFRIYREKIRTLATYLRGHQVTVIAYLRPQVGWLESAISQTIRIERLISERRIYNSDEEFFELAKPLLRYDSLISAWNEELRPSSWVVVPYDRAALKQESVIADFLDRAGVDPRGLRYASPGIEVNTSIARDYIEIKKRLNHYKRPKSSERVLIRTLQKLSKRSEWDGRYRISSSLAQYVREFGEEHNKLINERYIGGSVGLRAGPMEVDNGSVDRPTLRAKRQAIRRVKRELNKPQVRALVADQTVRAFLRENAQPVHSILHQGKRIYRRIRYGSLKWWRRPE